MQKHNKVLTLLSLALVFTMLFTVFAPASAASDKVRVWVEFAPGKKANVEASLMGNGAEFHYTFDNLNSFVVTVPAAALNGLSKNPNIVDIEEDVKRYPMAMDVESVAAVVASDTIDPSGQVTPWGVTAVQAPEAWDTTTGTGIKLCIIDSGYYEGHNDLPDGMSGVSQVDNAWAEDGLGHGSHVAGTIAAENDSDGVVGVAYGVDLFIVKIFDNSGAWTLSSDLAAAANTCVANGADIISMSLGGGYSRKEERAFNTIYAGGVLSFAAASNDGVADYSYPASYSSVISVGALDESLSWADFSNFNDAVEVSAPGVDVLSTVPYVESRSMSIGSDTYTVEHVEYAAYGTASGAIADGGLCTSTDASWAGKVVMCYRGDISFYDKVMNVQNSGGAAAVIYNNVDGALYATLGDEASASDIVALTVTQADGQYIVANHIGDTAELSATYTWPTSGYELYNGTSMATPHASAVGALVWSACPTASAAEVRDALSATAMDLGDAGKDDYYGYGMVQAADAIAYLCGGVTPPTNDAPVVSITSPSNGATYTEGDSVSFSGSASDTEDGDLSNSIVWTSSVDGSLGTGASVAATLSVGTHTITATVTDSEGASDSDSITVTVNPVGGGSDLAVTVATDKASYGDREKVYVTTTVTADGAPVAGASVSTTVTLPSGITASYSGITGTDGTYTFSYRINARKTGTGTATVDSTASAAGYTDGAGSTTFIIQ